MHFGGLRLLILIAALDPPPAEAFVWSRFRFIVIESGARSLPVGIIGFFPVIQASRESDQKTMHLHWIRLSAQWMIYFLTNSSIRFQIVHIPKPFPVPHHIPVPVQVPVYKHVPIPIYKHVPVPVTKHVPVPVKVRARLPYGID